MLRKTVLLLVAILATVPLFFSCEKQDFQKKKILVVTTLSYDEMALDAVRSSVLKELGHDSYEYMFLDLDSDCLDAEKSCRNTEKFDERIRKCNFQPDLVVLYGDRAAHCAAASKEQILSVTPTVYIGVQFPQFDGLIGGRSNFCGYREPADIKKSLDFIQSIRPYTWVTTELDSGYMDDLIRDLARIQLNDSSRYNPNLELEYPYSYQELGERESSRMTLVPLSIEDESRNWKDIESGVGFDFRQLFYSEKSHTTFLKLKTDYWSELSTQQGLGYYFAITPERFNLDREGVLNICVGGYFTPLPVMMEDLHKMVREILVKGKSPMEIGQRVHNIGYWLDWDYMRNVRRYASDFPSDVHYVDLPWKDKSPLHNFLANYFAFILLPVLLLAFITLFISIGNKNRKKQQEIIHQGKAANATIARESTLLSSFNTYFFYVDKKDNITFSYNIWGHKVEPIKRTLASVSETITSNNVPEFHDIINGKEPGQHEIILEVKVPGLDSVAYFKALIENVATKTENTKAIGLMIRIDDLVKTHNDLKEAYRRDEESIMKSSFLASMGHEIRTPLNAIVGFSKIMVEMYDLLTEEEKKEYSGIITSNTEQLLSLIDNVITYSESQGKDLRIELSKKNVATLMEELYLTHSVIVPSNIQFKFIKGDPTDEVMVNRSSMLQVVSNLMNNAIKFTQSGYIAMGWNEDEDNVHIFVEDTGCGISEEFLDKIFDKYAKETSGTKGAGIGLALCKRLVEKMNGKILVNSSLNRGTTFDVVLPKVKH